ncbi:transcription factor bHLH92 [Vigna unguiculata]|uniref:transcription factor bHLH92 n=1 Tax=Vigna unguiculata TaxID=3917 RepID=UPI001016F48F|nr:transcription factor bHLH92 [Vigna unguiculata]
MDSFFPEKLLGEIFWDQPLLPTDQSDVIQNSHMIKAEAFPPATQSAFVQYIDLPRRNNPLNGSNSESMSKRMLAFLRKSSPVERNNVEENERDRSFRHMINERMRRQRQRQCCLALHSILPHGTKTDNNSVIQTAAKEIVRLQGCREELKRKNCEAEANAEGVCVRNEDGGSKIAYLRVADPECGIDSMVERLKWLKEEGVESRRIKSSFSPTELFAVLEIEW